jgi:hypothetical protein
MPHPDLRIPHDPPLDVYSPDDITAMLEDARANLPESHPWRRQLEEFEAAEIAYGAEMARQELTGEE